MKMGQIYKNAYLTVAASSAAADSDGFLRTRTQHISTAFEINHLILESGRVEFRVRTVLEKHKRHDIATKIRDSWRANLIGPAGQMEPLDYRAWVFQERLV